MKQLGIFFFASLAFIAGGLVSCNQSGESTNNNNNNNAADSSAIQKPAADQKTMAMVVSHHVKDYATWRPFFDKDEANRQAANMKVMGVFQDAADPNYVSISMEVADVAKAKEFGSSEQLKKAMQEAGVTDQPEIKFYELEMNNDEAGKSSDNRLFMVMKVASYEQFQAAFHGNDSLRKARGVTPVIIARNMDDPNEVALALTAADMKTLKMHAESPEVKAAIQKASTTGEPMIQYATKAKDTTPM